MLYTAESVSPAHPDKICDRISDAILDECLRQDINSRCAIEVLGGHGIISVTGELTTNAYVDVRKIVKRIAGDKIGIQINLEKQSPEIAQGVDKGGAGDQGCICEGELIATSSGFEKIEDILSGIEVVTPFGLKEVLDIMNTGFKEIIELIFKNGMKLKCTSDHLIYCYNKNNDTYWKEAGKLNKNDFICILKPFNEKRCKEYLYSTEDKKEYYTKYNHKIYGNKNLILDKDIGYLLGLLIGNGNVTKNKNHRIALSFGIDKDFGKRILKNLKQKYEEFGNFNEINKKNDYSIYLDSLLFRKHLENFGLFYEKSPFKTIPWSILLSSPKSVVIEFIKGLYDTDGTIVSNTGRNKDNIRIRYSSSSYRLLQEIQLLLLLFNIKTNIVLNVKKGTISKTGIKSNYDNYCLNIVGYESYKNFCEQIGFNNPRKQKRVDEYLKNLKSKQFNSKGNYLIPHPTKNELINEDKLNKKLSFAITQLKEIKKCGKANVYDLEIEDKHIFSANGIYVHNCMVGYACNENEAMIPQEMYLAKSLCKYIYDKHPEDGKTQITINDNKEITDIVVSFNNVDKIVLKSVICNWYIEEYQLENINIKKTLEKIDKINLYLNPAGDWSIGGFDADTGLTGRKIVVDAYGPQISVGGGCYSGKDMTKVDRSAAYLCRKRAIEILKMRSKQHDIKEVLVKVSYGIGLVEPIMITLEIDGKEEKFEHIEIEKERFKPLNIIKELDLRRPIFEETACWGAFGNLKFPWENV